MIVWLGISYRYRCRWTDSESKELLQGIHLYNENEGTSNKDIGNYKGLYSQRWRKSPLHHDALEHTGCRSPRPCPNTHPVPHCMFSTPQCYQLQHTSTKAQGLLNQAKRALKRCTRKKEKKRKFLTTTQDEEEKAKSHIRLCHWLEISSIQCFQFSLNNGGQSSQGIYWEGPHPLCMEIYPY